MSNDANEVFYTCIGVHCTPLFCLIMTFLIFSQISFQTTTKTSHFSLNLFSTRITCFGAQALVMKVKFTQTEVYKDSPLEKIDPLRSNPAPSPTVPLLHCPHGPSMPRFFSLSADSSPPPIARAGQAPRTWGRLAALLVLKVVLIGKGTRTLLDVDKTVMMATPPPQVVYVYYGQP